MKVFKYKFTKLIIALIYVCLALCAVGFAVNLYQVLTVGLSQSAIVAFTIIRYVLMFFVTVALAVILISLLLHSNYTVKGKEFCTNFGFIKSKYNIDDITEITLDRKTDKLCVTFKNETFMMIVVKPEWYEDFIQALMEANPDIEYYINSVTGEDDDKKNKS
ncbi:MAG: PH domain-containing protein [Clostridia bacterium]|nr:PH domain-containing protein [Clostridia bacterium]